MNINWTNLNEGKKKRKKKTSLQKEKSRKTDLNGKEGTDYIYVSKFALYRQKRRRS